jgi:hypothetical protein
MGPGVNAGEYRGIDDVIRFNSDWEDAWADTAYDLAEIEELDDHNVVARIEMRLRGEGSGVEVTATAWWLFEVRDERFLRWHLYSDRESALAAAAER